MRVTATFSNQILPSNPLTVCCCLTLNHIVLYLHYSHIGFPRNPESSCCVSLTNSEAFLTKSFPFATSLLSWTGARSLFFDHSRSQDSITTHPLFRLPALISRACADICCWLYRTLPYPWVLSTFITLHLALQITTSLPPFIHPRTWYLIYGILKGD